MVIQLSHHKVAGWTDSIRRILAAPEVSVDAMEKLLGRLNHVGHIMPMSRHFLGRLRKAHWVAQHRRGFRVKLNEAQRDDLQLWQFYLEQAGARVSLNNLVF